MRLSRLQIIRRVAPCGAFAILVAIVFSGCTPRNSAGTGTSAGASSGAPPVPPQRTGKAPSAPSRPAVTLDGETIRAFPFPASHWRVDRVAISPDGQWLAVTATSLVFDNDRWLSVYSLNSGAVVFHAKSGQLGQRVGGMDWHPSKPLLAIDGGRQAPVQYGATTGGLLFIRLPAMKRTSIWFEGYPGLPCAWMPDGRRVITADPRLVDSLTRKAYPVFGLWPEGNLIPERIALSPKWSFAAETQAGRGGETRQVVVYRKLPGRKLRYKKVATLPPAKDPEGGGVTSYCTQPAFLVDGRLAYVRMHTTWRQPDTPFPHRSDYVDTHGAETADAEVWIADSRGRPQKTWLKLPTAHVKCSSDVSERQFAMSPDGRRIVYVRDGTVYVKRVAPPR